MSRKITESELRVIFGLNAPAVTGLEKRWFEVGDIVSFTSYCPSYNNAEFQINNDSKWTMWFSQLEQPMYNGDFNLYVDTLGLQFCQIQLKDKIWRPFNHLPSEFWEIVKDKKFKVLRAIPCYRPNHKSIRVKQLVRLINVYKCVHEALIRGHIHEVKDMLKPAKCYDLVEI